MPEAAIFVSSRSNNTDDIKKKKFNVHVVDIYICNSPTKKKAVFRPKAKASEVFCSTEVVYIVFGKMATASGAVNLDVSRNNQLDCVESETINIPSLKRKRYFGCFDWIPFLKLKNVSTMQTHIMNYGILLTA
jgi:hypothetical protein